MKYRLFSDPGHSWLEVSLDELDELGIANKITAWSYRKGTNVYLEEGIPWSDNDWNEYLVFEADSLIEAFVHEGT